MPLHQFLEPMQCFLGDPDYGCLNLKMHHLALVIAKKTLDEKQIQKHAEDYRPTCIKLPNQSGSEVES